MARPSHPPRLDYSNYTWRIVQIMKPAYNRETVSGVMRGAVAVNPAQRVCTECTGSLIQP
jgi:hypothetical protein